jgi:hypothetical protein
MAALSKKIKITIIHKQIDIKIDAEVFFWDKATLISFPEAFRPKNHDFNIADSSYCPKMGQFTFLYSSYQKLWRKNTFQKKITSP